MGAAGQRWIISTAPPTSPRKAVGPGTRISLGGLVAEGSVERAADGATVLFTVTDLENTVAVSYLGILPDLFREGQGVVTRGKLNQEGVFVAEEVLAKHDETYMPPEVADALKRSGKWRHAEDAAGVTAGGSSVYLIAAPVGFRAGRRRGWHSPGSWTALSAV